MKKADPAHAFARTCKDISGLMAGIDAQLSEIDGLPPPRRQRRHEKKADVETLLATAGADEENTEGETSSEPPL